MQSTPTQGSAGSAEEILGIQIRADDFQLQPEEFVDDATERRIGEARKMLEEIVDERSSYEPEERKEQSKEAYQTFFRHYPQDSAIQSAFDSSRAARRLSWALCYRGDEGQIARSRPHLESALDVIGERGGQLGLVGIFNALLQSWDCDKTRPALQSFIAERIEEMEKLYHPGLHPLRDRRYAFLKSDSSKMSGPSKVAISLLDNDKPIGRAWEMLSLSEGVRGYPYVAELADAYTRHAIRDRSQSRRDYVQQVLDFLDKHDRLPTYKKCLSRLIEDVSGTKSDGSSGDDLMEMRENLIQYAFKHVGDPAQRSKWRSWDGASKREKEMLGSACKTLNRWVAQRFITAFFSQADMDRDRHDFWTQYTSHITRFKIFGDNEARSALYDDERIREEYVDQRFEYIAGDTSALLMQIKSWIIVEFGEVGNACYVHQVGKPRCPSFDGSFHSINDLKVGTSFPLLFRHTKGKLEGVKGQGRVLHTNGWEDRLHRWMQKKIGTSV